MQSTNPVSVTFITNLLSTWKRSVILKHTPRPVQVAVMLFIAATRDSFGRRMEQSVEIGPDAEEKMT